MSTFICNYKKKDMRAWRCSYQGDEIVVPKWMFGLIKFRDSGAIECVSDGKCLTEGDTFVCIDQAISLFTLEQFNKMFEIPVVPVDASDRGLRQAGSF